MSHPDSIILKSSLRKTDLSEIWIGDFIDPRNNKKYNNIIIKIITVYNPEYLELQKQEAKIAQSLNSDAVVKVYAQIYSEPPSFDPETEIRKFGKLYIIMEKLDYDSSELYSYIKELHDKKKYDDIINYLKPQTIKLLEALYEMHTKCVIHRDLKPENILVDKDTKNLKITDFGLSCFIDKCSGHVGTLNYMDPACYIAMTLPTDLLDDDGNVLKCKINEYSDIYSLGMTLAVIITGKTIIKKVITKLDDYVKKLKFFMNYITMLARSVKNKDLYNYYYLILLMIQFNPSSRPNAKQAIDYLNTGNVDVFKSNRNYIPSTCYKK